MPEAPSRGTAALRRKNFSLDLGKILKVGVVPTFYHVRVAVLQWPTVGARYGQATATAGVANGASTGDAAGCERRCYKRPVTPATSDLQRCYKWSPALLQLPGRLLQAAGGAAKIVQASC